MRQGLETGAVLRDYRRVVLVSISIVGLAATVAAALLGGLATDAGRLLLPIVSFAIIGAAAWALLSQPGHRAEESEEFRTVECGACHRTVLADWRLCPYCGTPLGSRDVEAQLARR